MEHQWVKITITPLEILEDENGKPTAFADPIAITLAEQNAQYGCLACNEPLETHYKTSCSAITS